MNLQAILNIIPTIVHIKDPPKAVIRNSALTGAQYYQELICSSSVNRFKEIARMTRQTFLALKSELKELKCTDRICQGQKLMIFITAMNNNGNRELQERWQHSGQTISKIIHEVADSLISIQEKYIKQDLNPEVSARIMNDPKYSGYFDKCIGAIDGTHIPANVPNAISKPFRNRKGFNSQNVLAACNFDMTFSYVLAGWEGSAHDSRVFSDALTKNFPVRNNRYYLGDAGYALSKNVLTPYRGTRYHLKEWGQGNILPRNQKELFNLRHSSLRNVIERVFGVAKKRFPTLSNMPSYPFSFQVQLVNCILLLHTFIRQTQLYDDTFDQITEEKFSESDFTEIEVGEDEFPLEPNANSLNEWRDGIANRMWQDYVHYNLQRSG